MLPVLNRVEAQNNGIRRNREQSRVNIGRDDNHAVYQRRINADAYHDEKALKCQERTSPLK